MIRYALTIMGMKKPIYFDTIGDRNNFISKIKGIFTYSTFTKKEATTRVKFEDIYKKYDGKYGDLVEAYVKLSNKKEGCQWKIKKR